MNSSRVKDKEVILVLDHCFVTLCSGLSEREDPMVVKAEAVHSGSGWDAQSRDWPFLEQHSRVAVAFRSCPSRRQLEACHRITNTTIPCTITITTSPPTTSQTLWLSSLLQKSPVCPFDLTSKSSSTDSISPQGNQQSGLGGPGGGGDDKDSKDKKKDKPKYEPPPRPTTRIGRKKKKQQGPNASAKLPQVYPTSRCKLRYLRMQRIHDHLLLEEEYVENQERLRKAKTAKEGGAPVTNGDPDAEDRNADERGRVDDMRGSPMGVGTLEEMIDDDHAIVSSTTGPEYYVSIMSFVDKDLLEPGASVLLHHKSVSIVGVLTDDADPLVTVMKLDKAPTESYADIGGLEQQIQEVRESVELPLMHPELYEEMGIKPPKGVILYGAPGTGKTLLAKAVANQTSATFLRIVGSELIQKYLGDGPRLVRQLFQVAAENAPSIVFIDEIDAIGTKRYESTSGGEREVQRTMLELLNQLDGFDDRGDVKVIMATNKIDTLDPALIRPGRIDRKILFENPDQQTKRKIFTLHTSKMSLNEDVDLEEFINQKDDLSGADIKAICSEAGLMALRERRMRVQMADFRAARERVLKTKTEGEPEGLYL
ncbi:hypothetical protein V498_06256 [Pseudogymnoascus sp. VKM F-4517 (FW-2822)]|nr:hypothetical protein V498_06256 [Pseudogymnoascus sp. VKM F-4517 (FW-2822)]